MKKISIFSAAAVVLLFTAVSCASVPKTRSAEKNTTPAATDRKTEADIQTPAADSGKQQDTETEKNYGDLAEPVNSDIPPDAGSSPAQEEKKALPSENEITEPYVRDEPYTEQTGMSEKKAAAGTQPAAETQPVEQKNVSETAGEKAPVKQPEQRVTPPAPAVSRPKTASVQQEKHDPLPAETATAQTSDGSSSTAAVEKAVPSRSVTLGKNQYLDAAYPGTGWIYLGETGGTKNLTFFGRKLGETDTSFTLRAKNTGRSLLHFYKNDILTGKYIDDYLEVNITDKNASTQEHVSAPSYADVVPPRPSSAAAAAAGTEAPVKTEEKKSGSPSTGAAQTLNTAAPVESPAPAAEEAPVKTVIQTTESAPVNQSLQVSPQTLSSGSTSADGTGPESSQTDAADASAVLSDQTKNESADNLLKEAQDAYGAKQYEKAQALLTLFFDKAVTRIDEGLYLQGQVLEAKSSIQNIKGAVDSYEILMKNWPDSALWQDARRRDIYLRRMYIDIR